MPFQEVPHHTFQFLRTVHLVQRTVGKHGIPYIQELLPGVLDRQTQYYEENGYYPERTDEN